MTTLELPSLIDGVQLPLFHLEFGRIGAMHSLTFTPCAVLEVPPLNTLLRQDQIACMAATVQLLRQKMNPPGQPPAQNFMIHLQVGGERIDQEKIGKLATGYNQRQIITAQPIDLIRTLAKRCNGYSAFQEFLEKHSGR